MWTDVNGWTEGTEGQMEQVDRRDRCEWVDRGDRWTDVNG